METGKWVTADHIPSGSRTRSGKVRMRRVSDLVFDLRCTVRGCGYRRRVTGYLNAQKASSGHAAGHQFGSGTE